MLKSKLSTVKHGYWTARIAMGERWVVQDIKTGEGICVVGASPKEASRAALLAAASLFPDYLDAMEQFFDTYPSQSANESESRGVFKQLIQTARATIGMFS